MNPKPRRYPLSKVLVNEQDIVYPNPLLVLKTIDSGDTERSRPGDPAALHTILEIHVDGKAAALESLNLAAFVSKNDTINNRIVSRPIHLALIIHHSPFSGSYQRLDIFLDSRPDFDRLLEELSQLGLACCNDRPYRDVPSLTFVRRRNITPIEPFWEGQAGHSRRATHRQEVFPGDRRPSYSSLAPSSSYRNGGMGSSQSSFSSQDSTFGSVHPHITPTSVYSPLSFGFPRVGVRVKSDTRQRYQDMLASQQNESRPSNTDSHRPARAPSVKTSIPVSTPTPADYIPTQGMHPGLSNPVAYHPDLANISTLPPFRTLPFTLKLPPDTQNTRPFNLLGLKQDIVAEDPATLRMGSRSILNDAPTKRLRKSPRLSKGIQPRTNPEICGEIRTAEPSTLSHDTEHVSSGIPGAETQNQNNTDILMNNPHMDNRMDWHQDVVFGQKGQEHAYPYQVMAPGNYEQRAESPRDSVELPVELLQEEILRTKTHQDLMKAARASWQAECEALLEVLDLSKDAVLGLAKDRGKQWAQRIVQSNRQAAQEIHVRFGNIE